MKRILMIALVLASVHVLGAEERLLPKPAARLGMDVIVAIESRKSFKAFTGKQIREKDLSTILWSALGVTWRRGDKASIHGVDATTGATLGERRATVYAYEPTVKAYVLLSEGAFRYEPVEHALVKVSSNDLRDAATRQSFPGRAAVIILVADGELLGYLPGSEEDKLSWARTIAGLAAQNVYLAATALGHGTVLIWYVNRSSLAPALGLSERDRILYALPLGSVD